MVPILIHTAFSQEHLRVFLEDGQLVYVNIMLLPHVVITMTTVMFHCYLLLMLLRMMIMYLWFCVMSYNNLSMYAHETLNLPVPSELMDHLEMMKVSQHCRHFPPLF